MEKIKEGEINLKYIPTEQMIANILTKVLPKKEFQEQLQAIIGFKKVK